MAAIYRRVKRSRLIQRADMLRLLLYLQTLTCLRRASMRIDPVAGAGVKPLRIGRGAGRR